jgi:TonB-linked SusC/RagA family outer membrane protein
MQIKALTNSFLQRDSITTISPVVKGHRKIREKYRWAILNKKKMMETISIPGSPVNKRRLLMQLKLTTILLLVAILQVNGKGFAQKVTYSARSVSLQKVFTVIKEQTGYLFFYRTADLNGTKPVSVQLKEVPFLEALGKILKDQPLSFKIVGNTVVITRVTEVPQQKEDRASPPVSAFVVHGKVTNSKGEPLSGVSITLKGKNTGTSSDDKGSYSIEAAENGTLVFSYIGFVTREVAVNNSNTLNVKLQEETKALNEVVVTALGISREKKSLGYASQKISGEDLEGVNSGNVTNALSGKVAGVQVKRNTNMGGSTNIVIRGYTSLTGDNQALFVLDGVPVNNANFNSSVQQQGGEGYDYGNMASDINPDDIESINVLKGAAATALYGSRAANGAVIITTKSGSRNGKPVLTINSGITFSTIDKSTFPEYQNKYGAGYGKFYGPNGNEYFDLRDFDGDGVKDVVAPNPVFGSFGGAFDPDLLIFQWDAIDPESPYYMQKRPWVAAKNGPLSFFETPVTYDNSISLAASLPEGNYRLSYSNFSQKGLLPNSTLTKNNFAFNFSNKFFKKFTASASANYILTDAVGRNETGGDFRANSVDVFRKWWQVNVDVSELRDIYFKTRRNVSSFPNGSIGNLYWTRYENFSSDARNRFVGNVSIKYDVNKWMNILGRISADSYTFLREERINNGSTKPGKYTRSNVNFQEFNYDLMANFNKKITANISIRGLLGLNIRRNRLESISAGTNGGLIVDRLFSLSNSLNAPAAPLEVLERIGVDGYYGSASFGYKNLFYLDITGRSDHSSTLPAGNSVYFYPSVAASFIFSEFIHNDALSFGKLRLNYAEVGNSAPANSLTDVLLKPSPFGSSSMYAINSVKNNSSLKPENTVSYEAGVELLFYKNRLTKRILRTRLCR